MEDAAVALNVALGSVPHMKIIMACVTLNELHQRNTTNSQKGEEQ